MNSAYYFISNKCLCAAERDADVRGAAGKASPTYSTPRRNFSLFKNARGWNHASINPSRRRKKTEEVYYMLAHSLADAADDVRRKRLRFVCASGAFALDDVFLLQCIRDRPLNMLIGDELIIMEPKIHQPLFAFRKYVIIFTKIVSQPGIILHKFNPFYSALTSDYFCIIVKSAVRPCFPPSKSHQCLRLWRLATVNYALEATFPLYGCENLPSDVTVISCPGTSAAFSSSCAAPGWWNGARGQSI